MLSAAPRCLPRSPMSKPETGPEMGCEAKVMPHPSTWSGHGVIRSIEPRSPPGAPIRKLPGALVSVAQKFAETCVQAKRFGFNKLPFATTSAFFFFEAAHQATFLVPNEVFSLPPSSHLSKNHLPASSSGISFSSKRSKESTQAAHYT